MRIITYTCRDCGTIVSANELEEHQSMNCLGLKCDAILSFEDLTEEEQSFFLENKEKYQI